LHRPASAQFLHIGEAMLRWAKPAVLCLALVWAVSVWGETGREGWLRYAPLDDSAKRKYENLPATVVRLGDSQVLRSAEQELQRGLRGMLRRDVRSGDAPLREKAIVLGTIDTLRSAIPGFTGGAGPGKDGFWLTTRKVGAFRCLVVTGKTDRAVLYGVFALLSKIGRNESVSPLNEMQQPYAAIRWVDQWDNLDGSIERGYAGRSFFFEQGKVRADMTRVGEYARLLASIGINACTINNVNADVRTLETDFLPQIARIADEFRPWGVRLSLAVDLSSPKSIGGLDTFDPIDPQVAAWWKAKADQIYKLVPDFTGFVVKADSEGRSGPSAYGRTHADAANVIARAMAPHGGIVLYRAFVYNHHLDWHNPKADRAKAAYDNFRPLDGQFDKNVVLQIKYGPIDFQAREPVSPLFGGLRQTNEAVELQVTQEYTGQQRHLVYLVPLWKEALDFDLRVEANHTPVKQLASGRVFHQPLGGFVAVVNAGMDENWLAHPFAMANLYGFGRLAWVASLSAKQIAEEWARLTFGNDPAVVKTATEINLASWRTYEEYTGPLGAQTLTDILGSHYGPGIESSEENGWGQWHRADHAGIGVDRAMATGTEYTGQYPPDVAEMYESVQSTPDELVLFFHHVPYTHVLHSGKTVIQHIYDSHYEGASRVEEFAREWSLLEGRVDHDRYEDVLRRLEYQTGHAIVWRDAICNYFLRLSSIPDAHGRAGHFPNRTEAEAMELRGYVPVDVVPWENASNGKAIECVRPEGCAASLRFEKDAGRYEIDLQYFDLKQGKSRFRVYLNGKLLNEWLADENLPATKLGGDSSTRRQIHGVDLRPGDEIRLEGIPDGLEHAPLDYMEITPEKGLE
jgi:alpha-glucuronidase